MSQVDSEYIAYSSDGRHSVFLTADRALYIQDTMVTDESVAKVEGYLGGLYSVIVSPDGSHFLSVLDKMCYDFRRLRQSSTVVVSKVQNQRSLEECKSWTCIVLLGLRAKVQVKGLSY